MKKIIDLAVDRVALALMDARQAAGMSQGQLALRSGVGVKTISSYETGVRSPSMKVAHLMALAVALEIDPSEIMQRAKVIA